MAFLWTAIVINIIGILASKPKNISEKTNLTVTAIATMATFLICVGVFPVKYILYGIGWELFSYIRTLIKLYSVDAKQIQANTVAAARIIGILMLVWGTVTFIAYMP